MRKLVALVVVALAMLLSGCAQSVADAYSDFLANGDVLQRFEVCFDDISRGRQTAYTQGELQTLIEDLNEGYLDDEEAQAATRLFQEAAESLLSVLKTSSDPAQSAQFREARDLFDAAWKISLHVRRGVPEE